MKQRYKALTAEWREEARNNNQSTREYFLSCACEMLAGILREPILEEVKPAFLVRDYADYERDIVSGYCCNVDTEYDVDGGVLHLLVCDYCQDDELKRITQTDLKNYFGRLKRFCLDVTAGKYDNTPGGAPVFPLLELMRSDDFKQKVGTLNLHLVTNRICEHPLPKDEVLPNGMRVQYQVSDFATLCTAREEAVVLDFTAMEGKPYAAGLSFLPANTSGGADFFQAYLIVMPAEALVDCYDRFRGRILENNVRVYLQRRGKVNKGIHDTIAKDPHIFFVYNNGLALTADTVEFSADGSKIEKLHGLQVVNGGQTMACLHDARKKGKDISRITVQAKLTVIPPLITPAIVPYISRYSNSQNAVNDSDQHSNDVVQRFLEQKSRSVFSPGRERTFWYYERMRGQYDNELLHKGAKEQGYFKKLHPKKQLVRPQSLAKAVMTCEMAPYLVVRGGQKTYNGVGAIRGFADYTEAVFRIAPGYILNEEWYCECMGKHILMARGESIVKNMLAAEFKQFSSYAASVLAYSLSSLVFLLDKSGMSVNYRRVWDTQGLDSSLQNNLSKIARFLMGYIIGRPDHAEWLKKKETWDYLRKELEASSISLESDSKYYKRERPCLLSVLGKNRTSKSSYTPAQRRVMCETPDNYWHSLKNWLGSTAARTLANRLERRLANAELSHNDCSNLVNEARLAREHGWNPPIDPDKAPEKESGTITCEQGNPLEAFLDEKRADILVLERTVDMRGGSVLLEDLFERYPKLQGEEKIRFTANPPQLGQCAAFDLELNSSMKVVFAYARTTPRSVTYLPIVEVCFQQIAEMFPKAKIVTGYFGCEDSSAESRLRHGDLKNVVSRTMYSHPVLMLALPENG